MLIYCMLQRFRFGVRWLSMAAAVLAVAASRPVSRPTGLAMPGEPARASIGAAGLKVHVDPVTGRIQSPSTPETPASASKERPRSSHEGLVEEPGTSPAGGFKVDAKGRFNSALVVRLGPDGKPVMTCAGDTHPGHP